MTLLLAALACGAVAAAATLGNRLDSGAAAAQFKLPDPLEHQCFHVLMPSSENESRSMMSSITLCETCGRPLLPVT